MIGGKGHELTYRKWQGVSEVRVARCGLRDAGCAMRVARLRGRLVRSPNVHFLLMCHVALRKPRSRFQILRFQIISVDVLRAFRKPRAGGGIIWNLKSGP